MAEPGQAAYLLCRMNSIANALFLFVGGAVFLLAGYWIGATKYLEPVRMMRLSQNWPNAVCKIISNDPLVIPGDEDVGARYKLKIVYEFSIGEKLYRSEQFNFQDNEVVDSDSMSRLVDRLKPGQNCLTFYNPRDPSQSVLERKPFIRTIDCVISIVFAALGAALAYRGIRMLFGRH